MFNAFPKLLNIMMLFFRYLLVLDEDGAVTVECGTTGSTLWRAGAKWQPVNDMRLLQEEEDRAQFLFLLNDPDSEGSLLRIVSFPGVCAPPHYGSPFSFRIFITHILPSPHLSVYSCHCSSVYVPLLPSYFLIFTLISPHRLQCGVWACSEWSNIINDPGRGCWGHHVPGAWNLTCHVCHQEHQTEEHCGWCTRGQVAMLSFIFVIQSPCWLYWSWKEAVLTWSLTHDSRWCNCLYHLVNYAPLVYNKAFLLPPPGWQSCWWSTSSKRQKSSASSSDWMWRRFTRPGHNIFVTCWIPGTALVPWPASPCLIWRKAAGEEDKDHQ